MIGPIETGSARSYWAQMRSLALRLLTIFAVMLMPLGMAAAPAAPVQHRQTATPMQHCPEPRSTRHSPDALSDCTMACASALPATDPPVIGSHRISKFMPRPALIGALSGIELEIATPPPRRS